VNLGPTLLLAAGVNGRIASQVQWDRKQYPKVCISYLKKKTGGKKYLANVSRVVSVIYGVESWGRKSSKPSEG